MSTSKKELVYDREIAPLMTQIIATCQEHGIDIHATFDLGKDLLCTTHIASNQSPMFRMLWYTDRTMGNFDLFMSAMRKDAAKYGHSSIELSLMGIPESPDTNIEGVK